MKLLTDYPIESLGDTKGNFAPVREAKLISYDGDKYCKVEVCGVEIEIKAGYLYAHWQEISRLQAENEELKKERDRYKNAIGSAWHQLSVHTEGKDQYHWLMERIIIARATLIEALKK